MTRHFALIFSIMALMISYGGELIRYNPSNSHIEYSNNQGRSWYIRYSGSSIGHVRCLMDGGKELLLCSDKGVFYSNNSGRSWYIRNSSCKNFTDLMDAGKEYLATTDDSHLYYSNNQGRSWYRRK